MVGAVGVDLSSFMSPCCPYIPHDNNTHYLTTTNPKLKSIGWYANENILETVVEIYPTTADHCDRMFILIRLVMYKLLVKFINVYGDVGDLQSDDNLLFRRAICAGSVDDVKYLVEAGVKADYDDNFAVRWISYKYNDTELLSYLIDNGADIFVYDSCCLGHAAKSDRVAMVKYLLDVGLDVNAHKGLALKAAINNLTNTYRLSEHRDDIATIRLLLNAGADVSKLSVKYLSKVIRRQSSELLQLFIDYGTDFTRLNKSEDCHEVIERNLDMLVAQGVDVKCIIAVLIGR